MCHGRVKLICLHMPVDAPSGALLSLVACGGVLKPDASVQQCIAASHPVS